MFAESCPDFHLILAFYFIIYLGEKSSNICTSEGTSVIQMDCSNGEVKGRFPLDYCQNVSIYISLKGCDKSHFLALCK